MKLGTKILAGFGFAFLLSGAVLVWAVVNLRVLGRSSSSILSENYRSITAADRMSTAIDRQNGALLLRLLGDGASASRQYTESEAEFFRWFAVEENNITIEGEADIVERIRLAYRVFIEAFSALENGSGRIDPENYRKSVLPALRSVKEEISTLRELNQETMYAASMRTEKIAVRAVLSMSAIGGCTVIAGLAFSLILSRILVRPITAVTAALERIGKGEYETNVNTGSNDELGALMESFNTMAEKLKRFHDLNIERLLGEKRKNEEVLRTLDDGVLLIDKEMRITDANPAAESALELHIDRDHPKHFLECFNNEVLFDFIRRASETGKAPSVPGEKSILSVDHENEIRHFQFTVNPVVLREREPIGVVVLLRDVTALKELDRLKTEFLMTASHELRTPLTSIGMSLNILSEELGVSVDEKNREIVLAAGTEVNRLKALVNDILDLSKIESGRIDLEFEIVEAGKLLERVGEIMALQATEKKIRITLVPPRSGVLVKADKNKIVWVLTNLVSNAIRYTDPGGSITVAVEPSGQFAYFSVTDTGIGISPRDQNRIFEKFVQLQDGRNAGGSGLGLAICREIVRAHGGSIWVESVQGKGSVFTFTIPEASNGYGVIS